MPTCRFTMEYWRDGSWYVGRLCEVPGVFSQGKTLAEGTPQESRAHLGVAAAYLGESADAEEIE